MITTPIIIPIPIEDKKDKCPNCGRDEKQVVVCNHCGYEYPDDKGGGCLVALVIIMGVIIVVYLIITLSDWLFLNFDNLSLVEILRGQWEWIRGLRIR